MRAAVWVGLSDKKCLEHLQGLNDCNLINNGLIFRRYPINGLDKFKKIFPPRFLRSSKYLSHVYIFLVSIISCLAFRPDVCIGISMLPHSVMAKIAQWVTKSDFVTWLIGTDMYVEIHRGWFGKKVLLPMVRSANGTLCMGKYSKSILISLGWNEKNIIIGRNFYNYSQFYDLKPQERREKEKWDITCIGRLDRFHKRVDLLLNAVAEVKKQIPAVTCAIVGDGPDRLRLMALAHSLDLGANVFFLGHRNDVSDMLNNSRLFLLTSSWEGLPSSIVEALFCGLPVISSKVGDVNDVIENGYNGILISTDHPEDYSEAIISLLKDQKLYGYMSENARLAGESIKKKVQYNESALQWSRVLHKCRCYRYHVAEFNQKDL